MVPFVNIVICPTRPFPLTDHVRDGVHSGPSSPRRLSGRRGDSPFVVGSPGGSGYLAGASSCPLNASDWRTWK